jgi:CheY-like chemotaxis protein
VWVKGDPDRLTQVFSNLLSNAVKFTPGVGSVWLTLSRDDSHASVVVQDTGVGIPTDRLAQVFEMFAQVHAPQGNDGLGIGLALVQQIVRMHRGSVVAESEGPGRGSRFIVQLPLREPAHGDDQTGSNTATGSAAGHALSPLRILIVDDNVDAAESLEPLLTSRGHETRICTNGEAATDCVPVYRPDVVLMDVGLPGMDGVTAARLIRARWVGQPLRIIALTGWGQESDRDRTREAGFDAHLVKPVSWEELVRVLERPADG